MLGKTGPVGAYLDSVGEAMRAKLERTVRAAYGLGQDDGPRSFASTAWICRGTVPA